MQVRFEMSLDHVSLSRTVYNFLDFLGDVGGCLDALAYIGSFFVWILAGESLNNYLTKGIGNIDQ